jgi:hypothetical protein
LPTLSVGSIELTVPVPERRLVVMKLTLQLEDPAFPSGHGRVPV